jgi:hypothetical protein
MKKIFFLFVIFSSLFSFSQVNENTINSNSPVTPATNNVAVPAKEVLKVVEEQEVLMDSISEETIEMKSIDRKNKATNKSSESRMNRDELKDSESLKYEKNSFEIDSQTQFQQKQQVLEKSFIQNNNAARYQEQSRSPSSLQQLEMDNIVDQYSAGAPNSFDYHFFKYLAGNFDVSLSQDLFEAKRLQPKNMDVEIQLAAYNLILGKEKELDENLKALKNGGKLQDEPILYATHILASAKNNSVILTHGFDDFYSVLYAQQILEIKKDITLISLDLLQSEAYKAKLKVAGFYIPNQSNVDYNFLKEFCLKNTSKNLYLSMTFPKPYLKELYANLFVQGINFKYCENAEDLDDQNKIIYEEIKKSDGFTSYQTDKGKNLSSNYLPLLITLKNQYSTEYNQSKVTEIEEIQQQVEIQSNKKIYKK